ncbi:hypothetical protein FOZ61_000019 [Perkinsus olseni]|uniref:FLYWCH-type domain-containing protein n=1 Tax=Perkinsus olseni TaxID=32597 RepID=A0A7J6MZQ4_PEROL|nr:hypothetical protein FOZ61_000019 [Perkinsus olseni]KAF4676331.1 hypothetical protein FOL46_004932 [Perkinsus olseni]
MAKTATFRTSQRGKVVCIVDDNVYHMQRVYKDRVYWSCKSRAKGCKARLVTSGDEVVKQSHEHCCGLSTRGVSRANFSFTMPYNTPVEGPNSSTTAMPAPSEAAVTSAPLDFTGQQILCDGTMLQGYPIPPEAQVPDAPVDPLLC